MPRGTGNGDGAAPSPSPASFVRIKSRGGSLPRSARAVTLRKRQIFQSHRFPALSSRAPRAAEAPKAQLFLPGRRGKEMKAEVERKGIIHSESSCSACLAWDLRDSSSSLEQNVLQRFFFFFKFLFFWVFLCHKSEDLKAGSG